jgi:hypothetical protein
LSHALVEFELGHTTVEFELHNDPCRDDVAQGLLMLLIKLLAYSCSPQLPKLQCVGVALIALGTVVVGWNAPNSY